MANTDATPSPPPARRGKIVPRGADSVSEEFSEDALLRTTAMLTVGYSGADLANLLNEAGILAVRRNKPLVTMEEIETAMEKISARSRFAPPCTSSAHRLCARRQRRPTAGA